MCEVKQIVTRQWPWNVLARYSTGRDLQHCSIRSTNDYLSEPPEADIRLPHDVLAPGSPELDWDSSAVREHRIAQRSGRVQLQRSLDIPASRIPVAGPSSSPLVTAKVFTLDHLQVRRKAESAQQCVQLQGPRSIGNARRSLKGCTGRGPAIRGHPPSFAPRISAPLSELGAGYPTTMVRGVAQFARRPACLQSASAPDVPFCAATRVATVVILARHSVLRRRREIADLACADIRRRYQSLRSLTIALFAGDAHPVTSLLAKVPCAPNRILFESRGQFSRLLGAASPRAIEGTVA